MKHENAHEHLHSVKHKFNEEQFNLVRDLLSEHESEWQRRLNSIPLLAPMLGAFGLVSTFYGFEKILDQTYLVDHPWLLLATGFTVLLFTGVFYRKLQ